MEKSESLIELAEILGQQNNFKEILRIVVEKALLLFNAEISTILMVNPRTQDTIKTIIRRGKDKQDKHLHILQKVVAGWVSKNKKPFISDDILTDDRFKKDPFKPSNVLSAMCVPLYSEGTVVGFFLILDSKKALFGMQNLAFLEKFAAIIAPFISNVQKTEEYFNVPLPNHTLLAKYEPFGLLGKNERFIELLLAIEASTRCDVRVTLEGKSGTGKELIAKAIHCLSSRRQYPFIAIDCGAIPEHLIESELFGHVKGAFTGASTDRRGLFEEADHGTLFMDEINNLPQNLQSKLMRVLQESEIRPLGSNKPRKVDVRIISASSLSLRSLVSTKKFREDLYYRLNVYPIYVPDLNERKSDIPLLANYFLTIIASEQNKQVGSFHRSISNFLKNHEWNGNIRELRNFVERLVTICPAKCKVLDGKHLPAEYQEEFQNRTFKTMSSSPLRDRIAEVEEQVIIQSLNANNWNQTKTARQLSISERTLRYKMAKLKIKKPK